MQVFITRSKNNIKISTDVLDYKINKKGVTLKNLTTDKSLISDRYENILKRNIIGESSVKKKRNRK